MRNAENQEITAKLDCCQQPALLDQAEHNESDSQQCEEVSVAHGACSGLAMPFTQPRSSRSTMAKITYIQPDGVSRTVDAQPGVTVMEAAKLNSVAGIEAECGGACACATCHVYIDGAWLAKVGKPGDMEEDMLDFAFDVREASRLSCQIKVTAALDGLVLRTPDKQF